MSSAARAAALFVALLAGFGLLADGPPTAAELEKKIVRADRVRTPWSEGVLTMRVTTERPGAKPQTGEFQAAVKKGNSRVAFLSAADAGQFVLTAGDDAWLYLPRTKNPIKIPRSHRITGGFSVGDVARVNFHDDYEPVFERTDTLDGRPCDVIRLMPRKGRPQTFAVVRIWIDQAETLYRKAIFLLSSGKTAKDVTFDSYRLYDGVLSLERMTIVDALRPGKTTVDYLKYEKRPIPDAVFDPATARTASL